MSMGKHRRTHTHTTDEHRNETRPEGWHLHGMDSESGQGKANISIGGVAFHSLFFFLYFVGLTIAISNPCPLA